MSVYNVTISFPIQAKSRMEALNRTKAICRTLRDHPFMDRDYEPKVREISQIDATDVEDS